MNRTYWPCSGPQNLTTMFSNLPSEDPRDREDQKRATQETRRYAMRARERERGGGAGARRSARGPEDFTAVTEDRIGVSEAGIDLIYPGDRGSYSRGNKSSPSIPGGPFFGRQREAREKSSVHHEVFFKLISQSALARTPELGRAKTLHPRLLRTGLPGRYVSCFQGPSP